MLEDSTDPPHGKAKAYTESTEGYTILFNEPGFEANNKCRACETLLGSVQWKCSTWTNEQQCCQTSKDDTQHEPNDFHCNQQCMNSLYDVEDNQSS